MLATLFILQRIHIYQSKPPHEKKGWIAQSSSLTPAIAPPGLTSASPPLRLALRNPGNLTRVTSSPRKKKGSNPSEKHGVGLWSPSPKRVKSVYCVIFRNHPLRLSTEDTNRRGQFYQLVRHLAQPSHTHTFQPFLFSSPRARPPRSTRNP